MELGFGQKHNYGFEDAIDFISKSSDYRVVYTWDFNGNVEAIFYSSAIHKSAFIKRFAWDSDDNLIHVRLEDFSNPSSTQILEGTVFGNDGRSSLLIPSGALLDPATIVLKTSVNKKYCLTQNENDYISSTLIETDPVDLTANQNKSFKFVFSTLRYLEPKTSVSLFSKFNDVWEMVGTGVVDDTGYLITANMIRL